MEMNGLTHRRATGVLSAVLAASFVAAAPARPAFACGYHDPQQVSRGLLNWIYPDSLYVLGAIAMEIGARRLPPPTADPTEPDLFGRKYRATATALMQFGKMLGASEVSQPPASLVLVEPMLWTRFERSPQGLSVQVHVAGPQPGDLVLVTGVMVVGEFVAGRLTLAEAHARGLLRLYGSDRQIAVFLAAHGHVGVATTPQANAPADSADFASSGSSAADAASNRPSTAFQDGGKP